MRKYFINALKSSPILLNIVSKLCSFPSGYFIFKRSVNKIETRGVFLRNTKIKIDGKNSVRVISAENRLRNCLLYIKETIVR